MCSLWLMCISKGETNCQQWMHKKCKGQPANDVLQVTILFEQYTMQLLAQVCVKYQFIYLMHLLFEDLTNVCNFVNTYC